MKRLLFSWLLAVAVSAQEGTDLVVGDTTLVQRCVLKGQKSTRMIAVGQPGGFNYAFDAVNCAPVVAWSGGFLDFSGETRARGGNGVRALGAPQALGADPVPLRIGDPDALPASLRFRGYRRDGKTGAPTFLFETDGVPVEQQLDSPAPGVVSLVLHFPRTGAARKFYRIDPTPHRQFSLGAGLRWSGPGVIEIPAEQTHARMTFRPSVPDATFVREAEPMSGADLFHSFCSACHSTDGTKLIGPTLQGLWGRKEVVMRGGVSETITVDEGYVRESILRPQAAIVPGYEAVPMADYSSVLTHEQVRSLLGFLRELQ